MDKDRFILESLYAKILKEDEDTEVEDTESSGEDLGSEDSTEAPESSETNEDGEAEEEVSTESKIPHGVLVRPLIEEAKSKGKVNPWAVEKSIEKKTGKKFSKKKKEKIIKGIKKSAKKAGKKVTSETVKKKVTKENLEVVSNDIIQEDQFETVTNIPAVLSVFAGLGISGLIAYLKHKTKDEIEQLKADPDFMKRLNKIRFLHNTYKKAVAGRDVDLANKAGLQHQAETDLLKSDLKKHGYTVSLQNVDKKITSSGI